MVVNKNVDEFKTFLISHSFINICTHYQDSLSGTHSWLNDIRIFKIELGLDLCYYFVFKQNQELRFRKCH